MARSADDGGGKHDEIRGPGREGQVRCRRWWISVLVRECATVSRGYITRTRTCRPNENGEGTCKLLRRLPRRIGHSDPFNENPTHRNDGMPLAPVYIVAGFHRIKPGLFQMSLSNAVPGSRNPGSRLFAQTPPSSSFIFITHNSIHPRTGFQSPTAVCNHRSHHLLTPRAAVRPSFSRCPD